MTKAGSEIALSVLHEGASAPVDLTLVRETIKVASVRGRALDPGYVYLRVTQFQSDTGAEKHGWVMLMQSTPPGASNDSNRGNSVS